MSRTITPEVEDAIKQRVVRPIILAEIEHPDGTVNVWSGIGSIDWDGKTWIGLGLLGRIGADAETVNIKVQTVTFDLAGVAQENLRFLETSAQGRNALFRQAFLYDDGRIIPNPLFRYSGIISHIESAEDENGTYTISVVTSSALGNVRRSVALSWTHEQQQEEFPGDTGLDRIPQLTDKEIIWTPT